MIRTRSRPEEVEGALERSNGVKSETLTYRNRGDLRFSGVRLSSSTICGSASVLDSRDHVASSMLGTRFDGQESEFGRPRPQVLSWFPRQSRFPVKCRHHGRGRRGAIVDPPHTAGAAYLRQITKLTKKTE